MDYSPTKLTQTLKQHNFNFKKKYGQNFITDKNLINNIIEKSQITKDTLVIEIGPGAGALTPYLGQKAKNVLAYEIDTQTKPILDQIITPNTKIIYDDFLKRNIQNDLKPYTYKSLYLISNLPYYITTPIIIKVINEDININKLIIMVQKEVGNRFKATPNTKEYNAISVLLNYHYNIKKILDVSKNVFIPKPQVDSIVLELTQKQNKPKLKDKNLFINLVKDSFKQKRKTLKNNLKNYDLNIIERTLNKHNLTLQTRAENLPPEIFIEIANNLKEETK